MNWIHLAQDRDQWLAQVLRLSWQWHFTQHHNPENINLKQWRTVMNIITNFGFWKRWRISWLA